MLHSVRTAREAIATVIGIVALAGTALASAAVAVAEPPALDPPPCTAAEMARVMSGVTFDTSNYLISHPDVNDFFTSLKGQPFGRHCTPPYPMSGDYYEHETP